MITLEKLCEERGITIRELASRIAVQEQTLTEIASRVRELPGEAVPYLESRVRKILHTRLTWDELLEPVSS